MKKHRALFLILLCNLAFRCAGASLGTAFTYQGRLTDNGTPANGNYDLRFILYNTESNGSQVGNTLTNESVAVSNGLFSAALDFGTGVFDGSAYWLEVAVRTNGT